MSFLRSSFSRLIRSACVLMLSAPLHLALATDTKATSENAALVAAEPNYRNRDESWYWGFSLGAGSVRYKDAGFQSVIDGLKSNSAISHMTVGYDLHFLWPLSNHRTAIGLVLGGAVDNYTADATDEQFSVTSLVTGFSIQHYLTSNIGEGPFVRGDIGLATTQLEIRKPSLTSSSDISRGLGLRLAAGYSFLLSNETRLPVTVHWLHVNSSGNTTNSSGLLTVGVLF